MTLAAFLASLAHDQSAMDRFRQDPFGAMKDAGLSDKEILAVLSRKQDLLDAALGVTPAGSGDPTFVAIIVL